MSSFLPSQVAPDICHNHLIDTSAEVPVIVYQACITDSVDRKYIKFNGLHFVSS